VEIHVTEAFHGDIEGEGGAPRTLAQALADP
jgi:hypothetical protein